jgi:demethylmenaquinone methyltransferase/2-methoxy-6-polyprenyl-1,4-benzoquinol methylase
VIIVDTNYREMVRLESLCCEQFDKQVREAALSKLAPRSGEHVLVIGFAPRQSQTAIAQAVGRSREALGFDLSDRDQLGCGDANLLPYEPNSLDGIVTSYTPERLDAPPLPAGLRECKRVLRPGGRIVVVGVSRAYEPGPDREFFSLRRMLTAAGFTITTAELRRMWTPIEIVSALKGSDAAKNDLP